MHTIILFYNEVFKKYYTHALKEEQQYRKLSEITDSDTNDIAFAAAELDTEDIGISDDESYANDIPVRPDDSQRTLTSNSTQRSAETVDSACTVTEGSKSSSYFFLDRLLLFLIKNGTLCHCHTSSVYYRKFSQTY